MPERRETETAGARAARPGRLLRSMAGDYSRVMVRLRRGGRQHHAEARGDHQPDGDPRARHPLEDSAIPERGERAEHQDDVANQIQVYESHVPACYWTRTTIAARRFRRRVSSRALSYFGRSSP